MKPIILYIDFKTQHTKMRLKKSSLVQMYTPLESVHRRPSRVGQHETSDSPQVLRIRAIRMPHLPLLCNGLCPPAMYHSHLRCHVAKWKAVVRIYGLNKLLPEVMFPNYQCGTNSLKGLEREDRFLQASQQDEQLSQLHLFKSHLCICSITRLKISCSTQLAMRLINMFRQNEVLQHLSFHFSYSDKSQVKSWPVRIEGNKISLHFLAQMTSVLKFTLKQSQQSNPSDHEVNSFIYHCVRRD